MLLLLRLHRGFAVCADLLRLLLLLLLRSRAIERGSLLMCGIPWLLLLHAVGGSASR